jgi:hypothetical protein
MISSFWLSAVEILRSALDVHQGKKIELIYLSLILSGHNVWDLDYFMKLVLQCHI